MNKILTEEIKKFKKLSSVLLEQPIGRGLLSKLISKFSKTVLEDATISAIEGLEKRGLVEIDKVSKVLRMVDWDKLTKNELKLLFKSPSIRTMFENAVKEINPKIDLVSKSTMDGSTGKFRDLLIAYKEAEKEGLHGTAEKTFLRTPGSTPKVEPAIPPTSSHVEPEVKVPKIDPVKEYNDKVEQITKMLKIKNPDLINFIKNEYKNYQHYDGKQLVNIISEIVRDNNLQTKPWYKKVFKYITTKKAGDDITNIGQNTNKFGGATLNTSIGAVKFTAGVSILIGLYLTIRYVYNSNKSVGDKDKFMDENIPEPKTEGLSTQQQVKPKSTNNQQTDNRPKVNY